MIINKDVNEEEMTQEEFKSYCKEFDDNLTNIINPTKFKILCQKCHSFDVSILYQGKEIACGSKYTGCWTDEYMNLVFKCRKCGNAIGIIDDEI